MCKKLKLNMFITLFLYFPLVLSDKKHVKDDLEGRIKVRPISHEELGLGYGSYAYPPIEYGSYPAAYGSESLGYGAPLEYGYHGTPKHVQKAVIHDQKKATKKAGLMQKAFQKGLSKITGIFLGDPEPVHYERDLYYEPPVPRYVEVKVPKCKHHLEIPTYVTETLIRTSKYPVTKIHTKTKRVNVKEYVVNTKYHTLTETVTAYLTHHEPPKTVFKTVTVSKGYEDVGHYGGPLDGHYSVIHDSHDSYGSGHHDSSYHTYGAGDTSLEGSILSFGKQFSQEVGHHKLLQSHVQNQKPVTLDFKQPSDIEFHNPPKIQKYSVIDNIEAFLTPFNKGGDSAAFQYRLVQRSLGADTGEIIAVAVPIEEETKNKKSESQDETATEDKGSDTSSKTEGEK